MTYKKRQYGPGKHPNSLANLRPLKKGDKSRNPNGRPTKEKSITEALRVLLKTGTLKNVKHTADETIVETLAKNWVKQSLEKAQYFEMMLDRIEGKETQPISGEGGGAILISVVSENARKLTEDIIAGKGTTSGHNEME